MLLDADSFDNYATADITDRWTQVYQANGAAVDPIISAVGHLGTNGMFWTGSGNDQGLNPVARVYDQTDTRFFVGGKFTLGGSYGNLVQGGALYPTDGRSALDGGPVSILLYVRGGGWTHVAIRVNRNGTLSLVRGVLPTGGGPHSFETYTVLGTTTQALQIDIRYTIELEGQIGASCTLRLVVDGDTWLNLTNVTTQSNIVGAPAFWDEIVIGRLKSTAETISIALDDYYVANTDVTDPTNQTAALLGDVIFTYRTPTVDGVKQWTRSAGADNYANVDDAAPNDDTDYNKTAGVGNVDTFLTNALPISGITVKAMQVVYSRRRYAGGNTSTCPVFRIGGVDYTKPAVGDPSNYAYHQGIWTHNPATLAPLVEADLPLASAAANSVGYKKVT
jgi:hypothetical protein